MLGKRNLNSNEDVRPHNLPMTLIGTGLLWFGWFGFNAGSALAANGLAASALVTTHFAAATAGLVWMLIEYFTIKKATALGFASGAVAGLVAITPGAGFVTPLAAIAIGAVVPFISYGMIKLKSRFGYDDTLDVFAVHGCGGLWGALATGIFANKTVNSAGFDGLLRGNPSLLVSQLSSALVAVGMGILGTLIIVGVMRLFRFSLRVKHEEEESGLDVTQHGETAYVYDN
jgi:Amt family ammonium transporter